jgi:hypothetical protein
MEMPENCPICHSTKLVTLQPFSMGESRLILTCINKDIDHTIKLQSFFLDQRQVMFITIGVDEGRITWDFVNCRTFLSSERGPQYYLPFFEPDFSNYEKLISKIKTYVAFS